MSCSKSLDKFYTSDEAARTFISFISKYINIDDYEHIVEPSAGSGALLKYLPPKTIGIDLVPEAPGITQCDFFDFEYPVGKVLTVGNPPFGNRSKLAIDFFNKAAKHSDAICFIIPVTWQKYSIHKQLAEGWALIANERLPEESFELGGKPYRVRCVMQVWRLQEAQSIRITDAPATSHPDFDMWQWNRMPGAEKVWDNDFDFAVPRQGWCDYSRRETDEADCERKTQWALFKAHTQEARDILMNIDFDTLAKNNTKTPGYGKADLIAEYVRVKGVDLRKNEKEPGEHPDFIIKHGYNPDATFVIRGVRPKISDDINVFDNIDPSTRYYSVQPLVPGVREVFDRVEWNKHWQGVSMPTVSIPDCIEIYNKYKEA